MEPLGDSAKSNGYFHSHEIVFTPLIRYASPPNSALAANTLGSPYQFEAEEEAMAINIPPSPEADKAPDYARRLREVRELTQGKTPVKRRRRNRSSCAVIQSDIKSNAPFNRNYRSSQQNRTETHQNQVAACPAPNNERDPANTSAAVDEKPAAEAHAAAQTFQERLEKLSVARLVRFPRKQELPPKPTYTQPFPYSRFIAASAIISAAVSFVVTSATQGALSPVATGLLAASKSLGA